MGNKFIGFRKLIEIFNQFNDPRFNPPAKVINVTSQARTKFAKLQQITKMVCSGIKQIFDYAGMKEGYNLDYARYEPLLFTPDCQTICKFLQRNGVQIPPGGKPPHRSCGTEGCAYFYNDKVLKCTTGENEWKIATAIKGGELFPVIDTDKDERTGVFLILTWALQEPNEFFDEIDSAGMMVARWFDEDKINNWRGSDQDLERWLDVKEFVNANAARFSDEKLKNVAVRIFQTVVGVFRKSGMFVTADLHKGNFGVNDKNEPQMFDFGYAQRFRRR